MSNHPQHKVHFTGQQFPVMISFTRGNVAKLSDPLYHHGIEILFNFSGTLGFFSRDRLFQMHGNAALIIWPNDIHLQETVGHIDTAALIFIPSRLFHDRAEAQVVLDSLQDTQDVEFTDKEMTVIGFLLREIDSELSLRPPFWEQVVTNNITKLLVMLARADRKSGTEPIKVWNDVQLARILAIIDANLHLPLTLTSVANAIDCSPFVLCRSFKQRTGVGFKEFLTHARILKARTILRETTRKIAAVAREVGYRETSTFNRNFKRLIGMSPAAYRLLSADER